VQRYGAGVVVPGAADSVAAGIEDLVAAPAERRAAMTAGARRLVHDHFTWPEAARRVARAYLDVCAAGRPA